jgi:hypothetical protein
MEYEAYKVRGYGFGLKKEITGVLGRFPTQEEAQKVADDYTQACLPDNLPDSYDTGMVRPVVAGEPAAVDPACFAVRAYRSLSMLAMPRQAIRCASASPLTGK